MSTTASLVSLEEYLNSSYEPDMDFVDGVLLRRNVGTPRHALLQLIAGSYLRQHRKSHRIQVFVEARLLVDAATGRHRIPDVLVLAVPYQQSKVVKDVPLVIIEIVSPDDTFDDIFDRCSEYEKLGVRNILVMDPEKRHAWLFEHGQLLVAPHGLNLGQARIEFPVSEMFAELDEQ